MMPLDKVVLRGTPEQVGAEHGTLWRHEIPVLASIRTELTLDRSDLPDRAALRRLAAKHVTVLRTFDEPLFLELRAIADASGTMLEELIVLNHYTDLRDIQRAVWGPASDALDVTEPELGGCSTALLPRRKGRMAVSGQTWDMHRSATPFVRLVEFRPDGRPAACVLTLTGCLGMAGMNEHGVAVLINNLTSLDARIGIVWSALVRRMLYETTARGALAVLEAAPIGSGHHYLISDGREAFAIEASGSRLARLAEGVTEPILHTNHCLLREMQETDRPPQTSTTWSRLDRLRERVWADPEVARGATVEQLAGLFVDHQGQPSPLCLHLGGDDDHHAVRTCGAIAFDHPTRRILAVRGCTVDGGWVTTTVGEDDCEPIETPS